MKCDLHGQNEMYTGGHVRRCPYRLCPCEECQDHDQVLATLSRERRKRKEMREMRRGEALLSQVMVKKLREKMNNRSEGIGGLFESQSDTSKGEPIILSSDTEGFMSSDTEGFISDVDDYKESAKESVHGYVHISDELPDPEVRTTLNSSKSKSSSHSGAGHRNRSPFPNLIRANSPIFTPRRPLLTNVTSPRPSAWSPTPSSPSLLSSPSSSVGNFTTKVQKRTPLLVTLDSGDDSEGPNSSSEDRMTNTNIVTKKYSEQNRSPLTILKRGCRVLISPRPLLTKVSISTPSPPALSPTPSSPSLLSSPSKSVGKSSPKVQERTPVLVTLDSGESGDDSEGVESIICTPSSVGYYKSLSKVGMRVTNVDTKEKDFQVGVYSSIDELLHDSMEESENEYNEMDFDKKYLTGLDSEEEKLGAEDFGSESDTNNNELMSVEKNIDFDVISEEESHNSDFETKAKHNQKDEVVPVTTNISKMNEDMNVAYNQPSQVPPTPRPTRWDVPPPGLSVKLGKHPFQLPPIYHVAQISVPRSLRGLLMGKGGHFFRKMKDVSGTTVSLGPVYCTVKGSSGGVEVAMKIIHERLRGWNF